MNKDSMRYDPKEGKNDAFVLRNEYGLYVSITPFGVRYYSNPEAVCDEQAFFKWARANKIYLTTKEQFPHDMELSWPKSKTRARV